MGPHKFWPLLTDQRPACAECSAAELMTGRRHLCPLHRKRPIPFSLRRSTEGILADPACARRHPSGHSSDPAPCSPGPTHEILEILDKDDRQGDTDAQRAGKSCNGQENDWPVIENEADSAVDEVMEPLPLEVEDY